MQRTRNTTALYLVLALVVSAVSMSAFAEDRSIWRTARDIQDGVRGAVTGTVTDVDSARNRLYVTADDDRSDRVTVSTASSTQYSGFGVGSTVFNGANGFPEVRTGDRVEVRGIGRGSGNMVADNVVLLGRAASSSTSPGSTTSPSSSRYEGVVRQVNPGDSRLVIENDAREMLTILGAASTPVYYQRETYRIENIEVGDRIRVDPSSTTGGDVRARSIEVISSVSDNTAAGGTSRTNTVGSISGHITYVDTRANTFRVDTGRGTDVTVDVARATDDKRTRVKANDFLVGDRVTATGTWVGQNTFRATTIRWGLDSTTPGGTTSGTGSSPDTPARAEYISVVIYGTVQDTLKNSATISVKDKDMDRTVRVMLSEDFAVRTKTGSYTTADTLKKGDQIVVKAYRDNYGNYIAQTLRIR
jgi:hypothetical protein